MVFVEKTLSKREKGLPNHLLVIEDRDEYVMCIDTITKKVVSWSAFNTTGTVVMFDDFYEYFLDCIDNAIENFEE